MLRNVLTIPILEIVSRAKQNGVFIWEGGTEFLEFVWYFGAVNEFSPAVVFSRCLFIHSFCRKDFE